MKKDWDKVKLGDILTLEYGKSLPEKERTPGDYRVFGSNGTVGYHEKAILHGPVIIVGRKGSVGSVRMTHEPCWPIDTTYWVKTKRTLSTKWLFEYLCYAKLNHLNEASGVPGLNRENAYRLNMPFPPLVEQERIAEIFSDADAVIAKTENLAQQLNKQFIGFRNQAMKQIAEKTDAKFSIGDLAKIPQLDAINSAENKLPLEVSLHCKGIKINSGRKIKITASGRPYFQRSSGDFLIGRQNIHNGGFGIVPPELDGGIASSAVTTLRLNPKKINGRFFLHYFSRPHFYRRLETFMGGTGQKEMSDIELKRIKICLPDMQTQNEIASAIDGHLRACQLQLKLAAALKKQKRGLMQQLLTGKLRVNSKNKAKQKP